MKRDYIGKHLTQVLVIGLLIISGAGCGEAFDVTYTPADECWEVEDGLSMTSLITTTSVRPELRFTFDQDYPYTNLQLRMVCISSSGKEVEYKFQTTVLSPTGDWLIQPSGGGYEVIIALADEFDTSEGGEYTFTLMHNMRENQICGIRSLGMRLPK